MLMRRQLFTGIRHISDWRIHILQCSILILILSYLGFGVQLPTPTWGNMLSNTQNQMTTAPWTALFPGIMIFIVVMAINFLGDGLRDALDTKESNSVLG